MPTRRSEPTLHLPPTPVVKFLAAVVGVLSLCHLVAVFIYRGVGQDAFPGASVVARLLNMDGETNVPSWYSVGAILLCAALCAVIAVAAWTGDEEVRRWRWHWTGLAGVLAFLSLDEAALIHEELSRPLTRTFDLEAARWEFWAWIVPYTALGLLVLVVLWRFLAALPRSTTGHFVVAGVVFVAGAVGMELVGRELWNPFDVDATYLLAVGIEEVLEMAGVIILVRGLLVHLRDHVGPVQVRWGEAAGHDAERSAVDTDAG